MQSTDRGSAYKIWVGKYSPTPMQKTLAMKPSIFRTSDGRNHAITFALVSSLFLLWGFCNGMIDVMDKHFQKEYICINIDLEHLRKRDLFI